MAAATYNPAVPALYPICLDLQSRRCLVVGAGKVAARKIRGLLAAGATVRVVAPVIGPSIPRGARVEVRREPYRRARLAGCAIAFAAAADPAVNARVAAHARAAGILCCRCDEPSDGDFRVPAVARRGLITVAIDTGGAAPALAAALRTALESRIGPEYSLLAAELRTLRPRIQRRIADPAARARLLRQLAGPAALRLVRAAGRAAFRRFARERIESARARTPAERG
jgi:precorrin-2 dehydrogenase/sirohydrochlorin ferrochelatase